MIYEAINGCYVELAQLALRTDPGSRLRTAVAHAMHALAEVVAHLGPEDLSVYPPGWGPPSDTPIAPCGNVLPANLHQNQEA
jgi:hypothetical protein